MNSIALSTIILFIFILPGLISRRFYYTEEFSKEYFKQTSFEVFLSSFIPCLGLQAFWIFIVWCFGYSINFEVIGMLLSSKDYSVEAFKNISDNYTKIFFYHFTLFTFSAFAGYSFKKVVRRLNLDRKNKIFRFKNAWHYIFEGEFFQFPRAAFSLEKDDVKDIEFIYVDVLVTVAGESIIYDGILVDYELSQNHDLIYITLKGTQRRYLKNDPSKNETDLNSIDKEGEGRYYNIPGHILVIPFQTIINFNLTFYKLTEDEDGSYTSVMVE